MKSNTTKSRMTLVTVSALMVAAGVVGFRAQADQWDKKTILTVNQPIQITDTYLEPGTYVLKLLDSSSDRHIVQIFNRDQNHLINTVMAIPNYRLEPTGNSRFMFWETPPGTAQALRAWFYPGDNFGQEFRRPKQPRQLALTAYETRRVEVTTPPPVIEPKVKETEEPAAAATVPEPEVHAEAPAPEAVVPEAVVQEPQPQQEPELLAQNNPPPAPVDPPAAAPAAPATPQPEELPKTASPYPAIGLAGIFSLSLYGLLRLKQRA